MAKTCKKISHQNVAPGWGCCVCCVYNGEHRMACKDCGHKRCDEHPENKTS